MSRADYHTHTTFSDGSDTPEEMVQWAIAHGMEAIGFSDHSYTHFDESYCIPKHRIGDYQQTIRSLKEAYKNQIAIYCGIEQDLYSQESTEGFDYVIGSVHYILVDGVYIPVDETPQILVRAANRFFGGDIYALVEVYFRTVSDVVARTGADLIGHVDLIRKFNWDGSLFDEQHPRYRAAIQKAIDALLETGKPFESNHGAISRGYLDTPYPAPEWADYIRSKGGTLIPTSDSHRKETLCCFD